MSKLRKRRLSKITGWLLFVMFMCTIALGVAFALDGAPSWAAFSKRVMLSAPKKAYFKSLNLGYDIDLADKTNAQANALIKSILGRYKAIEGIKLTEPIQYEAYKGKTRAEVLITAAGCRRDDSMIGVQLTIHTFGTLTARKTVKLNRKSPVLMINISYGKHCRA